MTGHVFISHSDSDKAFAELVLNALESRGINCWIAPRDIPPGGSYADAILTAIEDCSCFVLIYTNHSNSSGHVLREVERALKFDKNTVPIRFDDSAPSKSLDYLLATVHWLSAVSESPHNAIEQAATRIASCIPSTIERSATQSRPPVHVPEEAFLNTTSSKSSRMWIFALLLIFAVVLLIGLSVFRKTWFAWSAVASATPTQAIAPSPPSETPLASNPAEGQRNEPLESLRRYFECFDQRDPATAYDLLSAKFRAKLSFKKFSETFASTRKIRLMESRKINGGENLVTIFAVFEETDADYHPVQWQGPIGLVREPEGWRIDTMKDLKRLSSASSVSSGPPTKLPIAAGQPARLPEHTWDKPHIYLQIANESQRKAAMELKRQLTNLGYVVAGVETDSANVDVPTDSSELRYFTPGDSEEAQRIAREVKEFFGSTGIVAYIPEGMPYVSHARQYEIWLSNAFR